MPIIHCAFSPHSEQGNFTFNHHLVVCKLVFGVIFLVCTQNFLKNYYFLPSDTDTKILSTYLMNDLFIM